jgi:hypothetical protein
MSNENDKKDSGKYYSRLKIILRDGKFSIADKFAELVKQYSSSNKNLEPKSTGPENEHTDYSNLKINHVPYQPNLERELSKIVGLDDYKDIRIYGYASLEDASTSKGSIDDGISNPALALRRKSNIHDIFHRLSSNEYSGCEEKRIPKSDLSETSDKCDYQNYLDEKFTIIPDKDPDKKK